jgi:hypothetical protein
VARSCLGHVDRLSSTGRPQGDHEAVGGCSEAPRDGADRHGEPAPFRGTAILTTCGRAGAKRVSPLCGNALDALVARGLKAPVLCIIDEHAGLRRAVGLAGQRARQPGASNGSLLPVRHGRPRGAGDRLNPPRVPGPLRDSESGSLTSLQQRLFKTGGRLVRHARYFGLQLAGSHLTQRLSGKILGRIERLAYRLTRYRDGREWAAGGNSAAMSLNGTRSV